MKNFKLIIEYDGTNYHGWQRQAADPTVQAEIEQALSAMTRSDITLIGAGRTDAGVHALGQAAHFRCETRLDPEAILKGLNSLLPPDIAICDCRLVAGGLSRPLRRAKQDLPLPDPEPRSTGRRRPELQLVHPPAARCPGDAAGGAFHRRPPRFQGV